MATAELWVATAAFAVDRAASLRLARADTAVPTAAVLAVAAVTAVETSLSAVACVRVVELTALIEATALAIDADSALCVVVSAATDAAVCTDSAWVAADKSETFLASPVMAVLTSVDSAWYCAVCVSDTVTTAVLSCDEDVCSALDSEIWAVLSGLSSEDTTAVWFAASDTWLALTEAMDAVSSVTALCSDAACCDRFVRRESVADDSAVDCAAAEAACVEAAALTAVLSCDVDVCKAEDSCERSVAAVASDAV